MLRHTRTIPYCPPLLQGRHRPDVWALRSTGYRLTSQDALPPVGTFCRRYFTMPNETFRPLINPILREDVFHMCQIGSRLKGQILVRRLPHSPAIMSAASGHTASFRCCPTYGGRWLRGLRCPESHFSTFSGVCTGKSVTHVTLKTGAMGEIHVAFHPPSTRYSPHSAPAKSKIGINPISAQTGVECVSSGCGIWVYVKVLTKLPSSDGLGHSRFDVLFQGCTCFGEQRFV
jgi:hypothetical protein